MALRSFCLTLVVIGLSLLALGLVGCGGDGGGGDTPPTTSPLIPLVPATPAPNPTPNPTPGDNIAVFLADKESFNVVELFKYDEKTDTTLKLNGELVNGGDVIAFAISPDRVYVAYVADQETDEHFELYVTKMDGSGFRRVSVSAENEDEGDDVAADIVWAPDSSRIAYRSDEQTNSTFFVLRTVEPDGSGNTVVNPSGAGSEDVKADSVLWAPDSSRVAYLSSPNGVFYDLYTSLADDSVGAANLSGLTTSREILDYAWAPDNSKLLYIADRRNDGCYELFTNEADGGDNVTLSNISCTAGNLDVVQGTAVWAPNSQLVAYLSDELNDGIVNLYTVEPDGMNRRQLTNATGDADVISTPSWAPDSSQIAYVGDLDVDNTLELYTSLPTTSGSVKVNGPLLGGHVEVGPTLVSPPAWSPDRSPDRQLIAYVAEESTAGKKRVYVGDPQGFATTPSVPVSPEANTIVELGPTGSVWAPDGSRVLYRADQTTAFTRDLYTATVDGFENDKVTGTAVVTDALLDNEFGEWTPDSTGIVYLSAQDSPTTVELYGSTIDGAVNGSVSGALVTGGNVEEFELAD